MRDSDGEGVVVLHVDDDPQFGELVATFLEREDERFTVETATGADEGLTKLTTHDIDYQDLELARLLVRHTESALDLLARERELQRQSDRVEEFARVVSRDLQNPKAVARGYLDSRARSATATTSRGSTRCSTGWTT